MIYKAILDYFLNKIPNSYIGTVTTIPKFDIMLVIKTNFTVQHLLWRYIPDNSIYVRTSLNGDGVKVDPSNPNFLQDVEQHIIEFIKRTDSL